MNNKIIIFYSSLFLLISFIFLSYQEQKIANINNKNIWIIHFDNPKDASLNFSIENHSNNTIFHYEISSDSGKIKEENLIIENTKTYDIQVTNPNQTGKISIKVSSNNESKEIYKIF